MIGTGFVGRSSRPGSRPIAVTVLPERRRRGLGGELLDRCLAHVRALETATALGTVREDDGESAGFVLRRGFEVVDRVVSLALDLEPGLAPPPPPDGIEIVELDDARYESAFVVYGEGVEDIPTDAPLQPGPFSEWVAKVGRSPLTLVALDGGKRRRLCRSRGPERSGWRPRERPDRRRPEPSAPRHRRSAEAGADRLGSCQHGYRQVTTSTHAENEAMCRLNEKLGYRELPALLDVTRPL